MIFRPDLAALVMADEKTQTRRACSDNPRSPWWRTWLWRQHKAREPIPEPPRLKQRDREIMQVAVDTERLGFVLAPMSPQARTDARRLVHEGWGSRGFIGVGVRGLLATPMGLVEVQSDLADSVDSPAQ